MVSGNSRAGSPRKRQRGARARPPRRRRGTGPSRRAGRLETARCRRRAARAAVATTPSASSERITRLRTSTTRPSVTCDPLRVGAGRGVDHAGAVGAAHEHQALVVPAHAQRRRSRRRTARVGRDQPERLHHRVDGQRHAARCSWSARPRTVRRCRSGRSGVNDSGRAGAAASVRTRPSDGQEARRLVGPEEDQAVRRGDGAGAEVGDVTELEGLPTQRDLTRLRRRRRRARRSVKSMAGTDDGVSRRLGVRIRQQRRRSCRRRPGRPRPRGRRSASCGDDARPAGSPRGPCAGHGCRRACHRASRRR